MPWLSDNLYRFADRLLNHYEKLFLFTRYQGVEATNNAAERSLRHIVLWRKTSYGTQSEEGSRFNLDDLKEAKKECVEFFRAGLSIEH